MSTAKVLVAGSLAYDHIMHYPGLFETMLLPNMLSALSVTFVTSSQQIYFGGCGGNIAYTLKLLGGDPLLLGLAGKDFGTYQTWLEQQGIDQRGVKILDSFYTASAFILTDQKQNQLTIFQEGAMQAQPEALHIKDFQDQNPVLAIIAPDDARRMVRLAQECHQLAIPYLFDPAQQIGNLSAEDLRRGIEHAEVLIVNAYEAELLMKKMGLSHDQLSTLTPTYIETRGENGCFLKSKEGVFHIPAVKAEAVVDPTGCGDAFRGGILFGMAKKLSLEKCCKIGTLAATYNLEKAGTQGHFFTPEDFQKRFEDSFHEKLF